MTARYVRLVRERVMLVIVVAAATFAVAPRPVDFASLVGHAAVVALAAAMTTARGRGALASLAGLLAAATFVLRPGAWIAATTTNALALAFIAMLPNWRGASRDLRRIARDASGAIGVALSLPFAFATAAAFAGSLPTMLREISIAMPVHPAASFAFAACEVLVVILALDGLRDHPSAKALARVVTISIAAFVALRVVWIASIVRLPTEAFWPEAPLLVNALKLDSGENLYGPPEELSSYTYSPLVDVLHHAILKPFGAELSVFAHRAIVLVEQTAAIAVLGVALWKRVSVAAFFAIALAALANLLAPALHPDHALLLFFAIAIALVVAEAKWPRKVWWTALVLVTPIATAFKLSGAGIGVGLALVFALERRWRAIGALAISALLTFATIPLFDATLGAFRAYAIGVQAAHPIVWSRLVELPTTPVGLATIAAIALHVWMRGAANADARRVACLTASITLASLPAYLKYGGRDNNIALLLLGVVIAAALRSKANEDAPHPLLVPVAALLATLSFRPPSAPPTSAERAAAIADFGRAVTAVRDADAHDERALLLVHSTAWIAAGHRDVPRDRFHSAVELFYAHRPEAELLFAHVEDGRYATIVVTTAQLRPGDDLLGRMNARLRAAIESRYDRVFPADAQTLDAIEGVVIFRKR
jgi:hypothetical protein